MMRIEYQLSVRIKREVPGYKNNVIEKVSVFERSDILAMEINKIADMVENNMDNGEYIEANIKIIPRIVKSDKVKVDENGLTERDKKELLLFESLEG